uniref:cyclin-I-like isoform X2 n=1 Tax=Oncorhynchus gorbuscha TaxID=8017 RepID=UPI001EAF32A9|nr:cyclin-I-like isoform X2 [Oncorhynchus gorbuscha]
MKFAEPLESQRLSFLLEKAASREALLWKVYVPKKPSPGSQVTSGGQRSLLKKKLQDTDISPAQRDEAVCWLINLHNDTKLYPETLSLAISILDRFLGTIKARPKYLRCIAIACYFLAAKTSEEDERVPLLRDLASSSRCGCSPSEILRMERIILDKLNWDLHAATPLEFLHIFHAMVLSCKPRFMVGLLGCNPAQHLSVLTQQLHYCLANSALLQPLSRGSMLALALITLELENICPDWLALTINLLRKTQIDSSQLIRCRELVSRHLSTQEASLPPNTVYIYQSLHHSLDPDPCTRGRESDTRLPDRDPPAPSTAPRDRSLSWVSSTTLLQVHGPPKPNHHSHQVSLRCKHSAKRKVEEMEVDEFYEGIKRLYNEENGGAPEGTAVTGEEPLEESPVLLVRREGHTSPCPPLQPVSVS